MGQISNVLPRSENFASEHDARVTKVSLLEMSPIFDAHAQKFRFGLFDHRAARTWDRILRCDEIGQLSTVLP